MFLNQTLSYNIFIFKWRSFLYETLVRDIFRFFKHPFSTQERQESPSMISRYVSNTWNFCCNEAFPPFSLAETTIKKPEELKWSVSAWTCSNNENILTADNTTLVNVGISLEILADHVSMDRKYKLLQGWAMKLNWNMKLDESKRGLTFVYFNWLFRCSSLSFKRGKS